MTQLDASGGEDSVLLGEDSATSLLLSKNSNGFSPCSEEATVAEYLPKCVSFHSISYRVTQRSYFKKAPPKMILRNVRYGVRRRVLFDRGGNQW